MPERNEYKKCTLVCGARRRQGERPADCFQNYSRHLQGAQIALPRNRRKAPARIAVDSRSVDEASPKQPLSPANSAGAGLAAVIDFVDAKPFGSYTRRLNT